MKILMTLKNWEVHPGDPMKSIYEDEAGKKYVGPRMNCMVGDIMHFELNARADKTGYPGFSRVIFHTSPKQK